VAATVKHHPKADPDNPAHIAAPMPGKVSSVAVRKGQAVRKGERLLSIEAMKMETAVYSPREATIGEIHVEAGTAVDARDLLLVLKD
jgi:pyruvate carboxylase